MLISQSPYSQTEGHPLLPDRQARRTATHSHSGSHQVIMTWPWCLNSPRRIVLPNIGNRLTVGHPIEHRKTGQGRPGPSTPTSAGDLNQLSGGTLPSRTQRVDGRHPIRRQPEIRPPQPPALPGDRRRPTPQQVQREGRRRARRQRPAQPPTTNEPARWQSQDAGCGGFPGHGRA